MNMTVSTDPKKIEELLTRGVEHVYPSREFLEARLMEGKPLKLYVGIDPTGPTLHIGHAIWLRKLGAWQAMGHQVIFLIGDFTAMIGDPTDKSAARKQLTRDGVLANCKRYKEQASRFIRFEGKNAAQLKYNSEWLAPMTLKDVVGLAAHFTVQQLLTRDMFDKRLKEDKPIYFHELMYPLMQGYDCVAMDVDGEMGGNDQTFNMLAGRDLMKTLRGREKFVVTMKLLADPTGKKMGKSEGNMITLEDSADEMFGKVMSWTDGMIAGGFELLTDVPMEEVVEISKALMREEVNPRDVKARLAREVVALYHGKEEAQAASDRFDQMFQKKEVPQNVPEVRVKRSMTIVELLVEAGLASSKSDARRLIEGGGVKVDEVVVEDPEVVVVPTVSGVLVQKGKRFFVKIVTE